jgi:phosphoribosylformylglycinamidine synthase subunit PurL
MKDLPDFEKLSDQDLKKILRENSIALSVDEARKIEKVLKRPPTLTEAILWGIQGSEHCSYKSSKQYLKTLPTSAPDVILGPGEDSGIVELCRVKGDRYGIVVSHESHNHPSQIVPYEGAATGIGGCVRDVACMGAKVIACMDPLRLGDLGKNEARRIADGVVSGIAGYGNPIGVPNLGGDAYFNEGFNDNCLVNVVSFGLIKESQVIHSYVPKTAAKEQWDIIIVGKPTDFSGMGGASFASGILEESEKEKNKGAVQEPNPFLKRHLLVSSYDLFKILQKADLLKKVSFKDMGAGGITCSTVEQVAKANLGAEIDLGKVNVALDDLPPSVIACAETQERFTWMCHPSLTQKILDHYNVKWDLPSVAENARACHIGKVKDGNFVLSYRGEEYVNAGSTDITEGLQYDRAFKPAKLVAKEPELAEPKDFNKILMDLLGSENIASRRPIYERYDKQVQGFTVIEAGEADAGVMAPLIDEAVDAKTKKIGAAFSTDGNPRYAQISPYYGAALAVVESMRNVAAVGAYPLAVTDCLNYGNPEKEDQMWELKEGIRGIADACNGVKLKHHRKAPTPVISGNVSLYNESKNGHVPPSAIICCIGKIDDCNKAVTMKLKKAGNKLYLIGARKDELGGSEYYRLKGHLGANVPKPDFAEVAKEIYAVTDAVAAGLVEAAHDISEGGLAVAAAEMAFGGRGDGEIGVLIDLGMVPSSGAAAAEPKNKKDCDCRGDADCCGSDCLSDDKKLFSETGGFVLEVSPANEKKFLAVCKKNGVQPYEIGITTRQQRIVFTAVAGGYDEGCGCDEKSDERCDCDAGAMGRKKIIDLPLTDASDKWLNSLREKM